MIKFVKYTYFDTILAISNDEVLWHLKHVFGIPIVFNCDSELKT